MAGMQGRDERVTAVLVDDHPLVCQAAESALRARGIEVCGVAVDSHGGLRTIERLRPTVAVVDLDLPPDGGCALIEAVRHRGLPSAIVVFTGVERRRSLTDVLDAGADGLASKRSPLDVLVAAVQAVAAGGEFVDPHLRRILDGDPAGPRDLSPRERDVLALLARGWSMEAAAGELHLSHETVRTHVRNARRKLGARTGAEAVAMAIESGEINAGR